MSWVFLNDRFLLEEQAFIPISDRGFLFGDGVFTSIRVCNGKPELLETHLQRLQHSCQELRIIPVCIKTAWIEELIARNEAQAGIWRLKIMLTGGSETSLALPRRPCGQLLMTLRPYTAFAWEPCRICLFPEPIERPFSRVKSLAYLDRLFVCNYAKEKGYEDALVCSKEGYMLETAFSNLFWFHHDSFHMPDSSLPYLKGVFISYLQSVKAFQFSKLAFQDIPKEAAVYLCNALSHVRPVIEIENQLFQRRPDIEKRLTLHIPS